MKVVTFSSPWSELKPIEIDDDRDIRSLADTLGLPLSRITVSQLAKQHSLRSYEYDLNFATVRIFQTVPLKRTIMRIEGQKTDMPKRTGSVIFNAWSIENARKMAESFNDLWASKFRVMRDGCAIGSVIVSHWNENTMETCRRSIQRSAGVQFLTDEEFNL